MMVSSLSYDSWLQHRRTFLLRGIYHAYMQRSHSCSTHPSSGPTSIAGSTSASGTLSTESGGANELLTIIQPMLVYTGLIEQLQCYFKVKKKTGGNLEDWEVVMKERVVNVKEMVEFSKELLSWLDESTTAADLQEAYDLVGVLADVLSTDFSKCEDFVQSTIDAGKS